MKTPSKYQITDIVSINFGISGKIKNAVIRAVHFKYDKVTYDVEIQIQQSAFTIIRSIDSAFIEDNNYKL